MLPSGRPAKLQNRPRCSESSAPCARLRAAAALTAPGSLPARTAGNAPPRSPAPQPHKPPPPPTPIDSPPLSEPPTQFPPPASIPTSDPEPSAIAHPHLSPDTSSAPDP